VVHSSSPRISTPRASSPRGGITALLVASVLWGTTGTAATLLPPTVNPVAIGAATMVFGGLLLVAFSWPGVVATLRHPAPRRWAFIGAIGVFVYPLAFYSAMDLAGVAIGNVVALGSAPAFSALLEWLVQRIRPTVRWFWCAVVAIAGIALLAIAGHATGSVGGTHVPLGVGAGLLAGLAYALYTYASTRAHSAGAGGRGPLAAMFGIGAIALLPVLVVTGGLLADSARSIAITGYLAVFPMFVAYLLFSVGIRRIRSSSITVITLLEPVVATVLAVTIVGERLTPLGWVGIVAILLAIVATVTARPPGKKL
jgi:DME family drug/metabolite transporter